MKKKELRKIYLAKQKSLSEQERQQKSVQIKEHFFTRFDLKNISTLHLFLSIKKNNEVDTSFIINNLQKHHPEIEIVVPRVDFENDVLEHLEFDAETKLEKSVWGINEPIGNNFVDEEEIDLVLVPLLCFDKRGFRVGYGKGFYDKFLSKCRKNCLKVGVSFFEPIEEILDVKSFDVPLDFCITPDFVSERK